MRASQLFSVLVLPVLLTALGVAFFLVPAQQISDVEARALAPWPAWSFEALREGSWTRDVELYVADHFPARESFVAFTFGVRARFGVRSRTTIYQGKGGALGGFDNPQLDERPTSSTDAGERFDLFAEDAGADDDAGTEADAGVDDAGIEDAVLDAGPPPLVTVEGGVLIVEGRGMMLLSATDETAKAFAQVLNLYGARLKGARVYAVMVPGAGAFYLPKTEKTRGADELHNLEVMRAELSEKVTWVDVAGELGRHTGENLYYRTDHHWTGRGAYYGYRALAQAAGFMPLELDDLTWRTAQKPTLGSLFRITQDPVLERSPDVTEYPAAPVRYQSVSYVGPHFETPVRRPFVDEHGKGYLVYLGGDVGLMAARSTSKNGRRALLVKNSFGNPLAPLLLPHFEQVIVVDYRMYFETVKDLVARFRITDVFVQNATLTANDWHHQRRLREVLATPSSPPDAGQGTTE
jgi:hypothetical protein